MRSAGWAENARVSYSLRTLTRAGWGKENHGVARARAGSIEVKPQGEGIGVLTLGPGQKATELRFLAMNAPAPLSEAQKSALRRALPLSGEKLLRGEPFTIFAMGDSVTATGDYPLFLAQMLERATGNRRIKVEKRAYPGKSIDATVRHWERDLQGVAPDLGLLMYGLNEQATYYPLDAYLEQFEWVTRRMAALRADTLWLQPTQHIDVPLDVAARAPDSNRPEYAFRTVDFASALEARAAQRKVPLAHSFDAVWGRGGATLEDAIRAMWPLYPSSGPLSSLLESNGRGDTIHPNALGHLAMARAAFAALTGDNDAQSPLQWSGETRWEDGVAISMVTALNTGSERRKGRLQAFAPTGAKIEAAPLDYDLKPGQSTTLSIRWPYVRSPIDLTRFPYRDCFVPGRIWLPLLDTQSQNSRVLAVAASLSGPQWARERQVVANRIVRLGIEDPDGRREIKMALPDAAIGALPLVQRDAGTGQAAVAQLRWARFGQARPGEATLDGDLREWDGQQWAQVGESFQAAWPPVDKRVAPSECQTRWAFKAGEKGVYFACRATGQIEADNFTLFFDSREPGQLGTVGPYFWVNGALKENGRLEVNGGETTTRAPGLAGVWRKTADGADIEIFVPYQAFDATSWPASGDLGVSIQWQHKGAGGTTNLFWTETGHPWNPRWYGVVRRAQNGVALPYVVRVK